MRVERPAWARLCEAQGARGVAQLGSARRSGRRGRRFKSCHPDPLLRGRRWRPLSRSRGSWEDGPVTAEPMPAPAVLPPEVTARWQARFRAPRVSLPHWAHDAPHRSLYSSDVSGVVEQYAWDRETGERRQVTDRPNGTLMSTLSPDGETIWWFADTDGDEFGVWQTQPFAGGPATVAVPEGGPAYPAGPEGGHSLGAL